MLKKSEKITHMRKDMLKKRDFFNICGSAEGVITKESLITEPQKYQLKIHDFAGKIADLL